DVWSPHKGRYCSNPVAAKPGFFLGQNGSSVLKKKLRAMRAQSVLPCHLISLHFTISEIMRICFRKSFCFHFRFKLIDNSPSPMVLSCMVQRLSRFTSLHIYANY